MIAHQPETRGAGFLHEVIEETPNGERLVHCMQCGSCGGSCPSGPDMQYTPRTLFAMINANQRKEVLAANTMWCCVSCYFCTTRCPQQIPITDIMYTLKRIAIRENAYSKSHAPALAKTFTWFLERYGRSWEVGLAGWFYMRHKPWAATGLTSMGLGMLARGRMGLLPTKIKKIDQLQAIIKKAREIGEKS
jgi:heterodisulfide reductase subunit C